MPDCPTPGVWVSHSWDMGPTEVRPHASEIDALRLINEQGWGEVVFVPFGKSVDEAHREARAKR